MGTFDDNRRTTPTGPTRVPHASSSELDPPAGDLGLRREVERFPFVPDDPARLDAGLLRGLQHPGRPGWSSGCARSGTRRSSSASPAASTRPTR